jgi:hypothetical protein
MPTRPGHCILNPSRFLFWIGGDGAVGGQQSIAAERRGFMKPENAYTNLELQPLPYVLLLTSAAPSSRQGPVSCWYLLFCRAPWTSTVYTYIKVAPMVLPPLIVASKGGVSHERCDCGFLHCVLGRPHARRRDRRVGYRSRDGRARASLIHPPHPRPPSRYVEYSRERGREVLPQQPDPQRLTTTWQPDNHIGNLAT